MRLARQFIWRKLVRDRQGATLAFTAVSMIVILAIMALCIDLAMAFTARGEAQRVADASALAGASVWLDAPPVTDTVGDAHRRAMEYASRNDVRQLQVDTSTQVVVEVIQDSMKVRVWVRSTSLGTWFARLLGITNLTVGAKAAAQASPAGLATCVKPFVLFDLWDEGGDLAAGGDDDDNPANNLPDEGEEWEYEVGVDDYAPFFTDPGVQACQGFSCAEYSATSGTGWGSAYRNGDAYVNDVGRTIALKLPNPSQQTDEFLATPGIYLPWRMPDPEQDCNDTGQGGDFYRTNIASCNSCPISLHTDYLAEPGAMIGPTEQGLNDLLDQDSTAYWDESTQTVVSIYGLNSPRVVNVAVAAPNQDLQGAAFPIQFNNVVTMFVDELQKGKGSVIARFMGPAGALGEGPTEGELTLVLRLVE